MQATREFLIPINCKTLCPLALKALERHSVPLNNSKTLITVHHYLVAAQLSSPANISILSSIFNKINTWKIALK